jgi:hypothetical protein
MPQHSKDLVYATDRLGAIRANISAGNQISAGELTHRSAQTGRGSFDS